MLDELPPLLPTFAADGGNVRVRVAAIEALQLLGYRDTPTIDLLIRLLDDDSADVIVAARRVLCLKTRQTLPGRRAAWDHWRASVVLPDEPPGGLEAWLSKRRALEASRRRSSRP